MNTCDWICICAYKYVYVYVVSENDFIIDTQIGQDNVFSWGHNRTVLFA